MNNILIDRLSKGKAAIHYNDNNVNNLKTVLGKAFPQDTVIPTGMYNYYFVNSVSKLSWATSDYQPNIASFPLSEFMKTNFDWVVKIDRNHTYFNQFKRWVENHPCSSNTEHYNYTEGFYYGLKNNIIDTFKYNDESLFEISFDEWYEFIYCKTNKQEQETNKVMNTDTRFPFELTSLQAQSIFDIACNTWKEKLAKEWSVNILLNKNIEVSEEFYTNMRKACTKEQNLLFDSIFGSDTKCPYKDGELIFVRDREYETWELRYCSGEIRPNGNILCYMNQKTSGPTVTFNFHAPATGVKLPE